MALASPENLETATVEPRTTDRMGIFSIGLSEPRKRGNAIGYPGSWPLLAMEDEGRGHGKRLDCVLIKPRSTQADAANCSEAAVCDE